MIVSGDDRMGRMLKNNLREDLKSYQFWLTAAAIVIIMLYARPIWASDANRNLLEELLQLKKSTDYRMYPNGMQIYNPVYVTDHALKFSFLYLLLPLAGLPSITRFCEENSSGFSKMIMVRQGSCRYLLANLISGSIIAFINLMLSIMIFFGIVSSLLPGMGNVAVSDMMRYNPLFGSISAYQSGLWYVLLRSITVGILGAFSVQLAYLIAIFTDNKFLTATVPVAILEAWQQCTMSNNAIGNFGLINLMAPLSSGVDGATLSIVWFWIQPALLIVAGTLVYVLYYERRLKRAE